MRQQHSFLSATLAELTRRRVLRTLGGYAVAVFVLLQLMDAAVEPLRLPDWLPTLVVILLILGFPVVFLLAWHFDLTSGGIRRATRAGILSRRQSGLLFGSMLLLTAGLGYVFYVYYSGVFAEPLLPAGAEAAAVRSFSAPQNSIAVLPFADLSAAGDQAYVSDGVAEEILNLLAQVEGLHVAARTSSFAFRDRQTDIREIGRALNVRTVLEGSVRTAGNRIRLTAQLINVEDGYHIWSHSYDRELDDLFAIQDEVASSIAKSLVDSFAGLERRSAGKTDSLAAANAYRTGRLHWWRRTPAELERAIGYFAEALEQDAGFAPAYAAMADTWLLLSLYGNLNPVRAIEKSMPMIEKALAIDPASAEAYAALGLARQQIGQNDSAESALRRAIEINEDYIPAHLWLSNTLGDQGRLPEQRRVLEQALAIDPLNEVMAVNLAHNLRTRGDVEAGRTLLENLVEVRPDSTMLLRSLAQHEFYSGALFEGWQLARRALVLEPADPTQVATMAKLWLTLGEVDQADALLTEALESNSQNYGLLDTRWLTLVVAGRLEDAERLVREAMQRAGDDLPTGLQRVFNLRFGMLALARGDDLEARRRLAAAVDTEDEVAHEGDTVLALTLLAMIAQRNGDAAAAAAWLAEVERKLSRARINGVDDADLHYSQAALLALRDDPDAALRELTAAYDRGFRELWLLEMDWRLEPLRQTPEFLALEARMGEDIQACLTMISETSLAMR
ncbi:hypothetical protein [Elongatibacter sediminis]|uniref:Tetratricopeptide repeat protein n=1 Tax=Elongatibacter sediminis TaxID=3119006 RepID=A0AAW9RBE6_9GAMM